MRGEVKGKSGGNYKEFAGFFGKATVDFSTGIRFFNA
jgi:hypothetical protein